MSYFALKHLHVSFALVSGFLFAVRGIWMLQGSALARRRSLELASYAIDTILLSSAIGLVMWSAQYPLAQTWLSVKVVVLLAYIVAGSIALKRGKTKAVRASAYVLALLLFAYILKVALTKQVL
jgi:uncharacterized membrane protein SirB2